MAVRILLIEGHKKWEIEARAVLCSTISPSADPPEILTYQNAEEGIESATAHPVDLAVAELILPQPGMFGTYALARIRELCPSCRTILISSHDYVANLVTAVADAFVVWRPDLQESHFHADLESSVRRLLGSTSLPVSEVPTGFGSEGSPGSPMRPRGTSGSRSGSTDSRDPHVASGKRRMIAGKYRLERMIGRGGMGVVYRAVDTFMQRRVAVKLMRDRSSAAGEREQRMLREILIGGRLNHPGIVTFYDAGFAGHRIYLVMEYVNGETLRRQLRPGTPLDRNQAITVALNILDALAYAHRRGVIHRDLKPENVLMERDGTLKVADFGLAKLMLRMYSEENETLPLEATQDLTGAGRILGTPGYMAPEQIVGDKKADLRADIYSLGAILFEMFHGRPLKAVVSQGTIVRSLAGIGPAPTLPKLRGDDEMDRILRKALALERRARFQNSEELAAALRSALLEPPADPTRQRVR